MRVCLCVCTDVCADVFLPVRIYSNIVLYMYTYIHYAYLLYTMAPETRLVQTKTLAIYLRYTIVFSKAQRDAIRTIV